MHKCNCLFCRTLLCYRTCLYYRTCLCYRTCFCYRTCLSYRNCPCYCMCLCYCIASAIASASAVALASAIAMLALSVWVRLSLLIVVWNWRYMSPVLSPLPIPHTLPSMDWLPRGQRAVGLVTSASHAKGLEFTSHVVHEHNKYAPREAQTSDLEVNSFTL